MHSFFQVVNGYLHYVNPQKTVVVDNMRVNDGNWHYMETRWLHEKLVVTVDYGQIQVGWTEARLS